MIVKASVDIQVSCDHCGLKVPAGLIDSASGEQFCCGGCRTAWDLIRGNGLDSYYDMANSASDEMSLQHRNVPDSRFAGFDSDAFLSRFAEPSESGQMKVKMAIDGIHCAACIWLIEKLPTILPGVVHARVNWSRGTVRLVWIKDQLALSTIARTLHQLGYTPHPIRESDRAQRFQKENRNHLARLGIAAALAGNNMVVSAALYFGMFELMADGISQLMRVVSCLVGITALLLPGRVFLKSAVTAIRTRTPHMDLPIAVALLAGTIAGTVNVVRGVGEIYFDSLSVLVFLLLVGRWLQFRQQSRATDAIELLHRMTPALANKWNGQEFQETFVELLKVDDRVRVGVGEMFPADGTITKGHSRVDESILTGESATVTRTVGDTVFAGTLNFESELIVTVNAVENKTRIHRIAELVESSSNDRPSVVQWADRIGGYFVVAVTGMALVTFWRWSHVSLELAIDCAIALLIVACPCALALATPLAIAVALGKAAQKKIMIKSGDVLQRLQNPGMIWLDKTGTLTKGRLCVEAWHGSLAILDSVVKAEQGSRHAVADALIRFAGQQHESNRCDDDRWRNVGEFVVTEVPGQGITGESDSSQLTIGNRKLMENQGVLVSKDLESVARRYVEQGLSPCWIAQDCEVVAIAAIGDEIRKEAGQAIEQLRDRGWQVGILSGDHQEIVDRVGRRLGIDLELAIGGVSPEQKLATVKKNARQSYTVLMVGDGVNDSGALAAADVGIAVKGGAEASLAAAPVYLAKAGLLPIIQLFKISDSSYRIMRRNLAVSLAYNLGFAFLAFSGAINPFVAALIMPASSLTVVSLSLRSGHVLDN